MARFWSSPATVSLLRALLAILFVQAVFWLAIRPQFANSKLPETIAEISGAEVATLRGPGAADLAAAQFKPTELPWEECCEPGYRALRASFDLAERPAEPLGIITRMSGNNYVIRINGSTIYREGRMELDNLTYDGMVRRVFLIPEAVTRQGSNSLEVVFASDEGAPYFHFMPPIIGDYATLAEARRGTYFRLNDLSKGSVAMGAVLSILLLIVVLRGGNTPVMRWFLVIVAAWTLQFLYFEARDPPIRGTARLLYLYTFVTMVPLGWLNLANHWSGKPIRLLGQLSTGAWLAMIAVFAAIFGFALFDKIDTVDVIAMWWGLVISIAAAVLFLRGVLRNYSDRHWETALFMLCLTLIALDAGFVLFSYSTDKYADIAMPFLILGLTAAFLVRNVRLFQSSASLSAMLQAQLSERTAELEAAHAREKAMVRDQAHLAERQRIMRDMHDGLGSQLMSMLLMARRGEADPPVMAEGLQTVIDEMRLMIDSMDSVGESLGSALTIFRERIEPRIAAAGWKLEWRENRDGELPDYGPRGTLQVFRIMQEAVTNALKHSTGDTLAIAIEPSPRFADGLRITVADNGKGLGAANPRGRGLDNMTGRAATVGGELAVEGGEGEVRVVLDLPAGGAA